MDYAHSDAKKKIRRFLFKSLPHAERFSWALDASFQSHSCQKKISKLSMQILKQFLVFSAGQESEAKNKRAKVPMLGSLEKNSNYQEQLVYHVMLTRKKSDLRHMLIDKTLIFLFMIMEKMGQFQIYFLR